jgi:hypothetical protein
MSVIKKGQPSAPILPDLDYIPNVGVRTIQRKDFMSYEDAKAFAFACLQDGMKASVRQQGDAPIWRVEAQAEGDPSNPDSDLQDTHELRVNVLYPDIKTNLVTREIFNVNNDGLSAKRIALLEKYANDLKTSDSLDSEYTTLIQDLATTGPFVSVADKARELIDELLIGSDTYPEFQYVYTHTFNFGSVSDLRADFSNVQRIFTTDELTQAENIPFELEMPAGEWIKLPPEQTVMFGGRELLKYEYWWAQSWSRLRYKRKS